MNKNEFTHLIHYAGQLCDDLLATHPVNEKLLSARAVLREAQAFVVNHWPETVSSGTIPVDSSEEDLRQIQNRLMTAVAVINSFTNEMHRAEMESGK